MLPDRVVFKYLLPPPGNFVTLHLPASYEVVHAGEQDGRVHMWMLVDPREVVQSSVEFIVVGTGWNQIKPWWFHIQTVCMSDGMVWHVFQIDNNYRKAIEDEENNARVVCRNCGCKD